VENNSLFSLYSSFVKCCAPLRGKSHFTDDEVKRNSTHMAFVIEENGNVPGGSGWVQAKFGIIWIHFNWQYMKAGLKRNFGFLFRNRGKSSSENKR